jgi:iron complex transport system permease protein
MAIDRVSKQRQKLRHYVLTGLLLLIALLGIIVIMVAQGPMAMTSGEAFRIVWAKLTANQGLLSTFKANQVAVIWEIRLPRLLCSSLVGMGLGVGGVIFQGILLNPLADPYTLGVSTGAAFGAALAILGNVMFGMAFSTVSFAFGAAFITLLSVILIAQRGGGLFSANLIISGIIVGAILSSGLSFIKMLAGENVSAIVFWLMGSFSASRWQDVALVAPFVLIGTLLAFIMAADLNVMSLGEASAAALGVSTKRIRLSYLVLGSCITAACVAVSGVIGFVGLVIPHMLRFWLTADNRVLLPLAGLMGALLLTLADSAARLLLAGEIPVGVLTTLLGGPFFIYIFTKRRRERSGGQME